jgi:hypothetical protein
VVGHEDGAGGRGAGHQGVPPSTAS